MRVLSFLLSLIALVLCVPLQSNPFAGRTYYVNPTYQQNIQNSIQTESDPRIKQTLQQLLSMPSAYWIDTMSKIIGNNTSTVQGILSDASQHNPVPLVVLIIYDLPNRDCHARASNGEICCYLNSDGKNCNYTASGDCSQGLAIYKSGYIDVIATVLKKYPTVPVVTVVEPDSLPNLATNTGDPRCGNAATKTAYMEGIQYAIKTLSSLSNVAVYLDAAHGGWLGWRDNSMKFAQLVQTMNVTSFLRGFSTNVANYQPLGKQCPAWDWCLNNQHQTDPCCNDPCHLESQYNPGNNELNYASSLASLFQQLNPSFSARFIIDTGRNGVDNMRQDCANWCNIRGAGVGLRPTTATGNVSLVDAYYWLKTPGESDGCTQVLPNGQNCPRYDSMCGSGDSIGSRSGEPRAPEAGGWFDYQIKQLAANAHL